MGLNLGKQFNRNYNVRIPFLDGFYNIGVYFDKRSTFLLFSNGKLVCTGTKNNQQLEDSMTQLIKVLKEANKNR